MTLREQIAEALDKEGSALLEARYWKNGTKETCLEKIVRQDGNLQFFGVNPDGSVYGQFHCPEEVRMAYYEQFQYRLLEVPHVPA